MTRNRATGFVFILLGAFYVYRASQPATVSRLSMGVGCALIILGLVRMFLPSRRPAA